MSVKLNNAILSKLIIDSLENEYEMDVYFNRKLNNKYMFFRPYTKKNHNFFMFLFESLFSFFLLLFSFAIPMINFKLIRLCHEGNSKNVIFIPSLKARSIHDDINVDTSKFDSEISFFNGDEKEKKRFNSGDYTLYLYCVFLFFKKYFNSPWFYRSILLIPEMIALVSCLRKSKTTNIAMTNQLDRWAYLISSFSKINDCSLSLYQHGTVIGEFKPKNKLPIVDVLYSYNQAERDFFKSNIIDCVYDCIYLKPKIKLSEISHESSLLIIGSGSIEHSSIEVETVKYLMSNKLFFVYIKPHPNLLVNRNYSDFDKERLSIISDNCFFPNVDVVIHFGSTLAIEYKNSKESIRVIELNKNSNIIEKFDLI